MHGWVVCALHSPQESANFGPQTGWLVLDSCIGTQPHPHTYLLSVATLAQAQ